MNKRGGILWRSLGVFCEKGIVYLVVRVDGDYGSGILDCVEVMIIDFL